jgi:DNA helicase-2/ATP-dependent DNA helicase PcrA
MIYPWYTFVLHELARPYQGCLHEKRIPSIHFAKGATRTYVKKTDVATYYLDKSNQIYSDRLGDFALLCNTASRGKVMQRINDMYSHIFVDEVQDLAGFDIDILELFLRSPLGLTLMGDIRQSTYRTSYAAKNKQFCGRGFVTKVEAWKEAGLCEVIYLAKSRRCIQPICDLADSIFPDLPRAVSENLRETGHDGVFVVRSAHVAEYQRRYAPQVLRLDKRFQQELAAENFGMVKGAGFERVLIVPYGGITKWLKTGDSTYVGGSADEVYVGITRAYQSVAFIHDGVVAVPCVSLFDPCDGN